jgi:peptide/nickel transport system permease protein
MDLIRKLSKNYLLRKLLGMFATIWLVVTLTFFMVRLMPGNPIEVYINQQMSLTGISYQEARNQAASLYNIDLDSPLWVQWIDYMKKMAVGDFGYSFSSPGTPVFKMIVDYLPWTLFSVGTAIIISFIIGILMGMYIAYKRGGWLDNLISSFASITSAVPNYLVGILLLILFGVQLRIIPFSVMRGTAPAGVAPGFSIEYLWGIFTHAIMPMLTYIISTIGGWILTMKNTTLGTLGEDYVLVARARGLKESRIIVNYVGRNAILPLFTTLVMQIGLLIGGSPLIETIFVYKGIGYALSNSLAQRDYPVMQAIFLCITISVIFANFAADLLYSKLDPRIKSNVTE